MATETKTFYPGAHNQSDYSYSSISGETNPVGKGSDNAGNYASINLNGGSRATTYIRWPFDCSTIPPGATIDSVSCKVAAYASSTSSSYVPTRTLQLYSGTAAKGSATTISSTSRSVYTLSCGTWTRDELQKCNLYIYAQRGTSSTTGTQYIRFYGADLTITYTYLGEKFMLRIDPKGSFLPEGYTQLEYIESTGQQYADLGFKPTSNTRIVADMEARNRETSFLFGARRSASSSDDPQSFSMYQYNGALYACYGSKETALSVDPVQRLQIDMDKNVAAVNGSEVTVSTQTFQGSYNMFLFCVNTAGTADKIARAITRRYKAYDNGTLIRDCYPCLNPSNVPGLYDIVNGVFYGSATSTPFVAGPVYNKVWHDIARVFKKISGIWVEQEELANVIEDGVKYKNGGEYINPYKTVTIIGTGNSNSYVTINGVQYTAGAVVETEAGDIIRVRSSGDGVSYAKVTVDGQSVASSQSSFVYDYVIGGHCMVRLGLGTHANSIAILTINSSGDSSQDIINFTVAGTTYRATLGMTWDEWVTSEYNTGGFLVSGSNILSKKYNEVFAEGDRGGYAIRYEPIIPAFAYRIPDEE